MEGAVRTQLNDALIESCKIKNDCCGNRCDSEGKRGLFEATRGKWNNLSFYCKYKYLSMISGGYFFRRLLGFESNASTSSATPAYL